MLRIVEMGGKWGPGQIIEDEMAKAVGIPIIELNFSDLGRTPEVEFSGGDKGWQIWEARRKSLADLGGPSASLSTRSSWMDRVSTVVALSDDAMAERRHLAALG